MISNCGAPWDTDLWQRGEGGPVDTDAQPQAMVAVPITAEVAVNVGLPSITIASFGFILWAEIAIEQEALSVQAGLCERNSLVRMSSTGGRSYKHGTRVLCVSEPPPPPPSRLSITS